jgi:signal transduction histidine kinase
MSIRYRLVLILAAVAGLLAIPALYGAGQLKELRDIVIAQGTRHATASHALGRFETSVAELDRLQRSYLVEPDSLLRVQMQRTLALLERQLDLLSQAGYGEAALRVENRFAELRSRIAELDRLVEEGRLREASNAFAGVRAVTAEAQEALADVGQAIGASRAEDIALASQVSSAAARRAVLAIVVALLLAALIGAWTAHGLVSPIKRLERAMARVAEGSYEVPHDLPYAGRDEVGGLSRSFRGMTSRLKDLERMRAEFVSVASHELKGPVHVISGYMDLLAEELAPRLEQRHREFLDLVREQIQATTRLTNRLLDISRLESGSFRLQVEPVSVEDLFASLNEWLQPEARRRNVWLHFEADPAVGSLMADPDLLREQILGNLVLNALKFTTARGEIAVRATTDSGVVRIDVADDGMGIEAQHLPYIFEKYYQSEHGPRRNGSGLGLAIARQAVEAHGGRILVTSKPGEGTVFSVLLPRTGLLTMAGAGGG